MSRTRPLVTVVITTHNRGQALADAVSSVRAQTHETVELVVVDDGSDPRVASFDNGIKLVTHEHPRGVCAARNSGVAVAEGDYVLFLDDDDTLCPDAIETGLRSIETSSLPEPVAALSAMAVVDEEGRVLEVRRPPTFPRGSEWLFDAYGPGRTLTVQNTLLVPREVVVGIGGWNESLKAWVHDDFFLRLARECSLQGSDRVTYRLLQPTSARDHVSRQLAARAAAMERTLDAHQQLFMRHRRKHARYLGTIAMTWLRVGDHGRARRAAWRSVIVEPWRPKALARLLVALGGPRVYAVLSTARRTLRTGLRDHRPGPTALHEDQPGR